MDINENDRISRDGNPWQLADEVTQAQRDTLHGLLDLDVLDLDTPVVMAYMGMEDQESVGMRGGLDIDSGELALHPFVDADDFQIRVAADGRISSYNFSGEFGGRSTADVTSDLGMLADVDSIDHVLMTKAAKAEIVKARG